MFFIDPSIIDFTYLELLLMFHVNQVVENILAIMIIFVVVFIAGVTKFAEFVPGHIFLRLFVWNSINTKLFRYIKYLTSKCSILSWRFRFSSIDLVFAE